MKRELLNEDALSVALDTLDGWNVDNKCLKRHWKFNDFAAALNFVNRVGTLAEAADHHPDITFGWGYADLLLTTHDRDGITDVDVALATEIDALTC